MVSSQQICKAIIIIHVHVPLHCTAWINRESWSLVEHTQAGSFTFLTFNFVLWRAFSLLQCSQKKKSTPEDNSLQIAVNRSFWSTSRFLFFFSLSFFFFFLSCLPSSSSLTFLDRFLGLVQWSWTRSRRGWVFGTGLVSAFTFTVWLTAALRLSAAAVKANTTWPKRLPVHLLQNKSLS